MYMAKKRTEAIDDKRYQCCFSKPKLREPNPGLLKCIKYPYSNHKAQSLCLYFISFSSQFKHHVLKTQATKVFSKGKT